MPSTTIAQFPHGTKNAIWLASHTTTAGTDTDTYLPAAGYFATQGFSQVALFLKRTADAGTTTMQPFFEFFDPARNVFEAMLDMNDGTAVSGVSATDGTYDERMTILTRAPIEVDADTVKIINTIHKAYQLWIPPYLRVRFRHGGTTVTNTFSAVLYGS